MAAGPLILVQADGAYQQVRRRGVFAVERACADSDPHLLAAVQAAQEQMIEGLAKVGFEYVDDGFELRGPLVHTSFSTQVEPDPDPAGTPPPWDVEGLLRWERAEKARVANRYDLAGEDMVDFELVASFRKRVPISFRAI